MTDFEFSYGKFAFYTAVATLGWLLAMGIRSWFSKKCRWSHKKKYVRIERWTNTRCDKHGFHNSHARHAWWSMWGVWVCDEEGCRGTGKDCFGEDAEWRIEHGQMVFDEKKMADIRAVRADQESPRKSVDAERAAEQGLPQAVHATEAMRVVMDLAVALKKGGAKVTQEAQTQETKEETDGEAEDTGADTSQERA